MIKFIPDQHQYISLVPDDRKWISVTTLIGMLKEPFDQLETATKCSTRKPGRWPNKWYRVPVKEIVAAWEGESNRSTELGTWYHYTKEQELYYSDQGVQVVQPILFNGNKVASDQKLSEGIYPEHLVYLDSAGICGQVDKPEVIKGVLNIDDYKTNKEIKRQGFTNWEGISKKFLKPVQHLDDCEFNTYSLQLSMYAYIILRHNPTLTLGKLTIEHVRFEETGVDKYGYPITALVDGQPVVKSVEKIIVPYLRKEVVSIIDWLKEKHG